MLHLWKWGSEVGHQEALQKMLYNHDSCYKIKGPGVFMGDPSERRNRRQCQGDRHGGPA